jgi:hypothetical protein
MGKVNEVAKQLVHIYRSTYLSETFVVSVAVLLAEGVIREM